MEIISSDMHEPTSTQREKKWNHDTYFRKTNIFIGISFYRSQNFPYIPTQKDIENIS